jgi:WD40 repeat protein
MRVTGIAYWNGKAVALSADQESLEEWVYGRPEPIRLQGPIDRDSGGSGFLDEGKYAYCDSKNRLSIWETDTGKKLKDIPHPQSVLQKFLISPDESSVSELTGSALNIFNWPTNDPSQSLPTDKLRLTLPVEGSSDAVFAYSHDGQLLAIGDQSPGIVRVFSTAGTLVDVFAGHAGAIRSLSFSADDSLLMTASSDGSVRLWKLLPDGAEKSVLATGFNGKIQIVSEDQQFRFATIATDISRVKAFGSLVNLKTGKQIWQTPEEQGISAAAFSADGKYLFVGGGDCLGRILDVRTGRCLRQLTGHAPDQRDKPVRRIIDSAKFSPSGDALATGVTDGTVLIWNVETGGQTETLRCSQHSRISSIEFSRNGAHLLTTDGMITWMWHTQSGRLEAEFPENKPFKKEFWDTAGADGAIFACGESRAVVASRHLLRVWDIRSGHLLFTRPNSIDNLKLSPDGIHVAIGGDESLEIYNTLTGRPDTTIAGHVGVVRSYRFSPDGTRLITGGGNGNCQVWDVASGDLVISLKGCRYSSEILGFDRHTGRFTASDISGTVKVFDTRQHFYRAKAERYASVLGCNNARATSHDTDTVTSGGLPSR